MNGSALALAVMFSSAIFLTVSAAAAAAAGQPDATIPFATDAGDARERADEARALLNALNARRRAAGLPALTLETKLSAIARAHGLDMIARGYFSHESPESETAFERMHKAGWSFAYAGENLAVDVDAAAAERALYRSEAHRENILEPHYLRVGIAAIQTPQGEIVVEDFSD